MQSQPTAPWQEPANSQWTYQPVNAIGDDDDAGYAAIQSESRVLGADRDYLATPKHGGAKNR